MAVNRYAVEIELESYAETGRQAAEWILTSLLSGDIGQIRAHVTRMTEDGKPDFSVRGGVYVVRVLPSTVTGGFVASIAKRPIRGTSAC